MTAKNWSEAVLKSSVARLAQFDALPRTALRSKTSATQPSTKNLWKELPSKSIQNQLVDLYFRNVHPLYPIIDEYRFCKVYFEMDDEAFFAEYPIILFKAMMFTALAVG